MKIWKFWVAVFLCSAGLLASNSFLPVDQIKAGMKGKGRTVFQGNSVEEFDVEIIGVLRNFQPQKDLILAKLKNDILDYTGVIQGMSGSPVYIDGKLIGAISYSLGSFPKEAIAGITPIGEMLEIKEMKGMRSSFSRSMPIKKQMSLMDLFEINKSFFRSNNKITADGKFISPLSIPLVFNGFSQSAFEDAKQYFSKLGFEPVYSGQSESRSDEISIPNMSLKGGDPVGVQLVSGDLSMTAVGTVTHVDGDDVLAFGHPLYNLGPVEYAMTKVKVLAVMPSLDSSFKLAVSDLNVGKITQDRSSGIFGVVRQKPNLIPLNLVLNNEGGVSKKFSIKIADDSILTPVLLSVVLGSLLDSEERSFGDLTLQLSGTIYLENGQIRLQDIFTGNFNASVTNLVGLVSAVSFFLMNNEFKDLHIYRMDLEVSASEEIRVSYLQRVWLDKYDVRPGEVMNIKVYSRNYRGESLVNEVQIPAPHLPSGSEFYLAVGDAQSMLDIERAQYRMQGFIPRNLDQLLRILNSLRKNNRIYFKIFAEKPGLFLKGEELPNLPPTLKSMFSSPRAASSPPTELMGSTLMHYQLAIPYVFQGSALFPIKIK